MLNEQTVREHNIGRVLVTLDSAATGYNLPCDTVTSVWYNPEGKPVQEIGYTSDVVYIQNKTLYQYAPDSVKILHIDSSFEGHDLMVGVDTTVVVKHYKNNLLKQEKHYPWWLQRKLEWTKNYQYTFNGILKSVITIHEDWDPEMSEMNVSSVSNSVAHYHYNETGALSRIETSAMQSDGENDAVLERHQYVKNMEVIEEERPSFSGRKNVFKTEIIKDEKGRTSQILKYNARGKLWFSTHFTYNKAGLLEKEEAFRNGRDLVYSFVTHYIPSK